MVSGKAVLGPVGTGANAPARKDLERQAAFIFIVATGK
jgi:hypothetical protein